MYRLSALLVRHGFTLGLGVAALGVVLLGLTLMWRDAGPALPPQAAAATADGPAARAPGQDPQRAAAQAQRRQRFLAQLIADARRLDRPLEPERYFVPFPLRVTRGRHRLRARGGRLLTRELRLSTAVRTLQTPLGGLGTYRAKNLVLTVENRTNHHVAFRVVTRPSGQTNCRPKARIPQPTLVLGPREALSRTECLVKGPDHLTVLRVEVIAIPAISYGYLVKLKPVAVGIPGRVAEGHTLPRGYRRCGGMPRQKIEQAIRSGSARWADVIDFYARYSCDRYDFAVGYRRPGPPPEPSPVLSSEKKD
jgi:hypothetical protein